MHSFFDVPRPVVIGHRGAAGIRPENTLLSFETALEQGARILESDVQITRDGVPILLHDPSVDRTTQGRGETRQLDLAELRRLDAGHAFQDETGATPFRGRGLRIPTLEEAFEAFPEARFNLEIKTEDPRATAATLDLVQRFDRAERTLLTAGEDDVMKILRSTLVGREVEPAIGACLADIVRAVQGAVDGSPMAEGVMALQIPATFGGRPLVTRELVEYAHAANVALHVWTINDLREIESLLALGVDGIVTDHPGRMARWLQRDPSD